MKLKKYISLVCIFCIAVTLVGTPAIQAEEQEMFKKGLIYNTFDTSLDGWEKGAHTSTTTGVTVERVTLDDGTTAMSLSKTDSAPTDAVGAQPTAINIFDDPILFGQGRRIVVETRFMQTGDGTNGQLYFKVNRPNKASFVTGMGNEVGHAWYTIFKADNAAFGHMKTDSWATSSLASVNTLNKWIDVKIVFSGSEDYELTATIDGTKYTESGTIAQNNTNKRGAYPEYTSYYLGENVQTVTSFNQFNSFTWYLRTYMNTLYVDYFEVYEELPFNNATAELVSESYMRTTDSVKVKFTSENPIMSLPKNAVVIEGVECNYDYDSTNQILTLTPAEELVAGSNYTVKVNDNILMAQEGISVTGTLSFDIETSDVNVYDLIPKGRIISGKTVTASYKYSSPVEEGTHTYQWQVSETGEENTFANIFGATSQSFEVTSEQYGKYLRFSMIPYDKNGKNGFETFSEVLVPEKAPVAENLKTDAMEIYTGTYIEALYDFSDENSDVQGDSEIKWYVCDSFDGTYNQTGEGRIYHVTENDAGKYIKFSVVPVSNSELEYRGEMYMSEPKGPVVDILEATNLLDDPGFENGALGKWINNSTVGWSGVDIQTRDVRSGNYAIHMPPRLSVNDSYGQYVNVTAGKCYVSGAWAKKSNYKSEDVVGFWPYAWSTVSRLDIGSQYDYTLNEHWQNIVGAWYATTSTRAICAPLTFEARETADVFLDDFYFGELLVGDIETYNYDPVIIPESGSTSLVVTSGIVLNQLGTRNGLYDEKVVVEIPETPGVYVDEKNNVVITSNAMAGVVTAEVFCEPSYSGASQKKFRKCIDIKLLANNNKTPRAENIKVTGIVGDGAVLTGSYDFYQVDGKTDASALRWMYSDSENGVYYDIPGATNITYTVETAYADNFIKLCVEPKTDDGLKGTIVYSNVVGIPCAPVAKNAVAKGEMKIGSQISGSYEYKDLNGEAEGISEYKWFISDSINGDWNVIEGQSSKTLTITQEHIDKYLKFSVKPVSVAEPFYGEEVMSEPVYGPTTPVALNVQIKQNGTVLTGAYKYYHPQGVDEDSSIYRWYVDGSVVSSDINYVANFSGTKNVTFSVTPVSKSEPKTGKTVNVSMLVTGTSGNISGGGGGGFAGGSSGGGGGSTSSGSNAGVTNINNMKLPESPKQEETKKSDINGHWGESYIKEMETRGVMKPDENGNFDPENIVSRSEMISYLFDALKLKESEYTEEFSDVSATDGFAGKLQTMMNNGTIASYHEFRPNDGISREEMCKILYISLENAGKLTKSETNILDTFSDKDLISDWAIDYVNTIYANKIMIGTSDTTFAPKENITRAQVATMLTRILEVMEKEAE